MKGWKTITTNVVALVFAAAVYFGLEIPEPDPAVVAGVLALINIILRFITTTPVGARE